MSKNRWALVCTVVHSLGETFPHQQVLTFEDEKEAIWYAASLLCENDERVTRDGDGVYRYNGQHWTAAQLIVEWRETNLDTELFHIWEVIEVSTGDVVDAMVDSISQGCGGCDTPGCVEFTVESTLKAALQELVDALERHGDFHDGTRVSKAIENANDCLRGV